MYESTSAECPDVNRLAVRMWSAYAKSKDVSSPVYVHYTKDYAYVKELLSYNMNIKNQIDLTVLVENNKWYFFKEAKDSNGTKLNFINLKRDVTRNGFTQESFVISFTKEEIEKYKTTGLFYKVYGTSNSTEIYLAPNYIEGFLDRLKREFNNNQSGNSLIYKSTSEEKLSYLKNNKNAYFLKEGEEPVIVYSDEINFVENHDKLTREGYVLLGVSESSEASESNSDIVKQAKKVSATKVLVVKKYEQNANYYIKLAPDEFGTRFNSNLTDAEKNKIGKSGIRIKYILNNTIASKSELKENDIITKVNEFDITNTKQFNELVINIIKEKKALFLEVIRNDKKITINF